jgi:CxxC-x17-CxxC domain-containing protein
MWEAGEGFVVEFSDRILACRDCGKPFTWTAGEQTFYAEKSLMNEPARCPECRAARKARLGLEPPRVMHTIVCAECGQETTVPFVPRNGRPVLCSSCFTKAKAAGMDVRAVALAD